MWVGTAVGVADGVMVTFGVRVAATVLDVVFAAATVVAMGVRVAVAVVGTAVGQIGLGVGLHAVAAGVTVAPSSGGAGMMGS